MSRHFSVSAHVLPLATLLAVSDLYVVCKQRAGSASCWQATLDTSWTSRRNSCASASGAVRCILYSMRLAHAGCTEPKPQLLLLIPVSLTYSTVPAAWKSGVTLQNVKLKVEAFDYLQLPIDVREGVVGRLQVQVQCCSSVLRAQAAHMCYTHERCTAVALSVRHLPSLAHTEHVLHAGTLASIYRAPAANCAVRCLSAVWTPRGGGLGGGPCPKACTGT